MARNSNSTVHGPVRGRVLSGIALASCGGTARLPPPPVSANPADGPVAAAGAGALARGPDRPNRAASRVELVYKIPPTKSK